MVTRMKGGERSEFGVLRALFDAHVLKLAGLEDLAALLTFDEFGVFIAAHDLHTGMFARLRFLSAGRRRRRLGGHKSGRRSSGKTRHEFHPNCGYFRPARMVVKSLAIKWRWISSSSSFQAFGHRVPTRWYSSTRSNLFSERLIRPLSCSIGGGSRSAAFFCHRLLRLARGRMDDVE